MTEAREQINVRVSKARLQTLVGRMRAVLGMPKLSQSDVVSAALAALEKEYPPGRETAEHSPPPPVQPTRRGRRPQKGGDDVL